MQATCVPGFFQWSVWQPGRNMFFNSVFIERPGGNLAVDPLALGEEDAAEIERRGGLAWVALTNRDHERAARAIAERFDAKIAAGAADAAELGVTVDRTPADGDELCGARVVALEGMKTAGEFALFFPAEKAVVLGDALLGVPAGALRLMPDETLRDPAAAALSLRKVAALRPDHLFVGDGAGIFGGATAAIWRTLEARTDCYVNKVNIDELPWSKTSRLRREHGNYSSSWIDVDFHVGAEKLGYRLVRLEPGKAFCPQHWHLAEEELFIVTEGEPTLVTLRGNWPLRKGDWVAFPTRESGSHKIVNESGATAEIIMISNVAPVESCFYPDSKKVLVDPVGLMLRDHPDLDYYDGE